MSDTTCYLSFSFWLTSFSMIISRSIHVLEMALFHSFLWPSSTPLYTCTMSSKHPKFSLDVDALIWAQCFENNGSEQWFSAGTIHGHLAMYGDMFRSSLPSSKWGQVSSVQSFSHVQLFATPWTAACQASLSITNSLSLLKLMSIESVMSSNHLILCHPLLLPPSINPSIRVFSNESVLCIRWPKYWSFSFSISSSNEYSGLISFRMDWLDLLAVQGALNNFL